MKIYPYWYCTNCGTIYDLEDKKGAVKKVPIFLAINKVIFEKENVDITHTYIDGIKIEANANKYTWVWKKSSEKNRKKVFEKVTTLYTLV